MRNKTQIYTQIPPFRVFTCIDSREIERPCVFAKNTHVKFEPRDTRRNEHVHERHERGILETNKTRIYIVANPS